MTIAFKPQAQTWQRPIMVLPYDKSIDDHAATFGLRADDFIVLWRVSPDRPGKIEGLSRSILVLDPLNITRAAKVGDRFALSILYGFDRIVGPMDCATQLDEWISTRNPPMHQRMLAGGLQPLFPSARDGSALDQEPQYPFDPSRDGGFPGSISL